MSQSLAEMLLLNKPLQEEKGTTEDRWLDGIIDSMDMSLGELWEFGDAQGGLAGCNSWGRKESDTTEQLK